MFITPKLLLVAFAIMMIIVLFPALLNPKKFQKAIKQMVSDEAQTRLLGLWILTISFLFLSVHWKLTGGWYIIIPIIGWLALIKGCIYIWFPKTIQKIAKKVWLKSENKTGILAFIDLLAIIALLYIGIYIY
ncbi:hypothetical protein HOE67_04450 [Candidatus Peregrinibacteria bacterium]|jgi:uncharacterized protein YjeT (DUF2065 family)|nr:hypothetical protein [Candidatus Peregrinibacteria bacterium]MBT4056331.1 hypothetical protein [Candidatus Peregrinibacteria bacterium]